MIRVGRLLPGGIVIEEGHYRPIKGAAILQSESGDVEEVIVFAKQLSNRGIATEITCAALGRLLSLPIPEPVLLFDNNN